MVNIGEQLLQPESGWKRIDDSDININYINTWRIANDANLYNSSCHICDSANGKIVFYVYTSNLRIINHNYYIYSNNVIIKIDDMLEENYSVYYPTPIYQILGYQKMDLPKAIHKVEIYLKDNDAAKIVFDAMDIDEDGYMCTQKDYELQESKNRLFPVRVADDTIKSEENVANYTATLVNGERQLLLLNNGDMYLSDGKGSHIKMNGTSKDLHNNLDVLDLLSTDGKDLFFNGKNIQKVELQDGQYGYSATLLNVSTDNVYTINLKNGSSLCEQIVQVWEFEEGANDITTIAKTFNNIERDNFYYDSENIEFTDDTCKIKDEFILENTLNNETKFYETKLNKSDFIDLYKLRSEVNELWQ